MIMPQKHISLSESLIGLGAFVLSATKEKRKTLDSVIKDVDKLINRNKNEKIYNNIDNIVLAIDYLFSIGAIDIDDEGRVFNVFS